MTAASARDIIGKAVRALWSNANESVCGDRILSALTSAGYRIVRDGEVDAATVERCVAEAERYADSRFAGRAIAAALRALVGEAK